MISPCVHILRQLAKQVHQTFGLHQGTKHTSPDLQVDIDRLMASLKEHRVYTVDEGRKIPVEEGISNAEVPNTVTEGTKNLQGPLGEYNSIFR